jgi:hypothetical protein
MQDRYVGDVGDFGKYGLLRALSGPSNGKPALSLGVVWYLVPAEGNNGDGSKIQYLTLPADRAAFFRECDPALFDTLREVVAGGSRSTEMVRDASVLPTGTTFFAEPLTFTSLERNGKARRSYREAWLQGACEATQKCELVFLDPDNGIGKTIAPHAKQGVKYTYPAEVSAFLDRGQSVVVYHHLGRQGTAREQMKRQFGHFTQRAEWSVFALLYHRGTARAFFIIESDVSRHLLLERARQMLAGPWSRHFELITPEVRD